MKLRNGLLALTIFILSVAAASAQTRTISLTNGDSLTTASPMVDLSGTTTFYGGYVHGTAGRGVFTFAVTFTAGQPVDGTDGIYAGSIVGRGSNFSITEPTGQRNKSTSTSGTIDAGTVTYRLTPDGRADIIGIVSNNLTIFEGKNRRSTVVGSGTLDYGSTVEGAGTIVLTRL